MELLSTQSVVMQPHSVLYGPAGSQKTRMIPTCPSPVICSTDQGLFSIREFDIPHTKCTKYEQCVAFLDWLNTSEAAQFQTAVIDDFTEVCEMRLKMELAQTTHGQQAYGKMADEMLSFLRRVREITTHTVILICKEDRIQDQNKALVYSPMIPGRVLQIQIPYLFGQVYRMESYLDPQTQQRYPVIRCQKNDQTEAKDRSGKLGELEQAHLGNIIAKVMS